MPCLTRYGAVPIDLGPLRSALHALPSGAWVFRADPESDKTCAIREGGPHFPQRLVQDVLDAAVEAFLKPGYQNRVVLSMVPAGEGILPHRDDFGEAVRSASMHCHIPLITDAACVMGFPEHGIEEHLAVGVLYGMDETQLHFVRNATATDRIHLLFAHFPHGGLA